MHQSLCKGFESWFKGSCLGSAVEDVLPRWRWHYESLIARVIFATRNIHPYEGRRSFWSEQIGAKGNRRQIECAPRWNLHCEPSAIIHHRGGKRKLIQFAARKLLASFWVPDRSARSVCGALHRVQTQKRLQMTRLSLPHRPHNMKVQLLDLHIMNFISSQRPQLAAVTTDWVASFQVFLIWVTAFRNRPINRAINSTKLDATQVNQKWQVPNQKPDSKYLTRIIFVNRKWKHFGKIRIFERVANLLPFLWTWRLSGGN